MSEETSLLIDNTQSGIRSSSSSTDNDLNDSQILNGNESASWKYTYGSCSSQEAIPAKNQIVFKWYGINAYGERGCHGRKRKFKDFFTSRRKLPKKQILKDVTGLAYPGELLVFMGASGAGKTTLLNCMTFRNIKSLTITGLITVNDQPITQRQLAAQSAYIQQDDLFIPWLTVREHLIFQALVRMDSKFKYRERIDRVENVIRELSLTKCQYVQIGKPGIIKGISGGERKRLSLAAELLTNPSLLFCDEPTSGLDSFMSLNVLQMLKSMAKTGRTVICTLHQPSSELYQMFDKICLMAEGRTAFLGTADEASSFFTKLNAPCPVNFNPADYYIQLLSIMPGREESCKQAVKSICDAYDSSELASKIQKETSPTYSTVLDELWQSTNIQLSPYKVSWFSQFRAVSWRCWLAMIRNSQITKVKFVQVFLVTFLISILFWKQRYDQLGVQNINGALFLFLTNSTFQNLMGVVTTFCGELPLFLREHKNGMYRTDVYFLSKMLADIPVYTALNMMLVITCYLCIGLNPQWSRMFTAVGIMILVVYTVMSTGYFISTFASSIAVANSLITLVVTPFLIFGGFFLSVKSVPSYMDWLSDFSWFKYGNTALIINQWAGVTNITCNIDQATCPPTGEVIIESLGIDMGDFWTSIFGLIWLTVGLRIIAFLVLLYKSYHLE